MHKSTLISYFIKSLSKKHSIKNDQKLSLGSPMISVPVLIAGIISNKIDHNKLLMVHILKL